jgi:hypothetical protein
VLSAAERLPISIGFCSSSPSSLAAASASAKARFWARACIAAIVAPQGMV